MVILLHFAYRKEAQFFLKEWGLTKLNDSGLELYASADSKKFLLITEEGIEGNLMLATSALSFMQLKLNLLPDLVLNLGVAGGISSKLPLLEVVSAKIAIRTNIEDTAYFQSFELAKLPPCQNKTFTEVFTAISADKRINNQLSHEKLHLVGDIVDRELWAIAFVASKFKVPCATLKIISDFATEDSCQLVTQNSDQLALQLYKEVFPYLQTILESSESIGLHYTKNQNLFEPQLFKNDSFYFTQTQKHQLKKLYLGHKIKDNHTEDALLSAVEVQELIKKETTSKKRASELLFFLYKKLNPFLVKHQNELAQILMPLRHQKLSFELDSKLEDETLNIHLEITKEEDYLELVQSLSDFQYNEFKKLISGQNMRDQE